LTATAIDTSVAVPLLVARHSAHEAVVRWWNGRTLALSGHALAETYSVLTRLPGDLRLAPADAAQLLRERFDPPLLLSAETSANLVSLLSEREISGGAVYDALVGLAAIEHNAELGTRDARARTTYDALGVRVLVADSWS
jgi:predicted nucleic acid-binding protein